jgi:hypothetical protein
VTEQALEMLLLQVNCFLPLLSLNVCSHSKTLQSEGRLFRLLGFKLNVIMTFSVRWFLLQL